MAENARQAFTHLLKLRELLSQAQDECERLAQCDHPAVELLIELRMVSATIEREIALHPVRVEKKPTAKAAHS